MNQEAIDNLRQETVNELNQLMAENGDPAMIATDIYLLDLLDSIDLPFTDPADGDNE